MAVLTFAKCWPTKLTTKQQAWPAIFSAILLESENSLPSLISEIDNTPGIPLFQCDSPSHPSRADIDPIYYCELLNTCPIKDDGDAMINSFIVSPKIVPYGEIKTSLAIT